MQIKLPEALFVTHPTFKCDNYSVYQPVRKQACSHTVDGGANRVNPLREQLDSISRSYKYIYHLSFDQQSKFWEPALCVGWGWGFRATLQNCLESRPSICPSVGVRPASCCTPAKPGLAKHTFTLQCRGSGAEWANSTRRDTLL